MLGLPQLTETSKQLPKKAIYTKFQMNTAAKEKIDADISRITIVNEIVPNKVNIPSGEDVKSFFVLLVSLKRKEYDEKTIATLSKLIPQNILFVLEYENESRLAIYHTKVMQTAWMQTEEQKVELKGLNLDTVWENIVIAVGKVNIEKGNSLDEQIEINEKKQKLEKEIAKLEKQATIDNNNNDNIPEALRKSIETSEKLQEKFSPILEQEKKMQQLIEGVNIPKFEVSTQALDAMRNITDNSAMRIAQDNMNVMKSRALQMSPKINAAIASANNNAFKSIGKLAIKSSLHNYQFDIPAIKILDDLGKNATANLISGLNNLVNNSAMREIQSITSRLGKWLQTIDFSPLTSILENIRAAGFDHDYREVNDVFLKAMFDAKWFPYAGWIASFRIVHEMLEILNSSRASKNRIKRIDRLIFSYYDKDEIDNFKRRWRKMGLPSYMIRILVQAVQAYHRREYALTVSALSTLWEGIIQEKVNDNSYRVSRKTRENLTKLIEENEFDKIFASFCEEFIFYDCRKVEEVKPDVPGRHGIAHCWYNTYPNKKMALNAILFTDFLLRLKPLEKLEEKENGQAQNANS